MINSRQKIINIQDKDLDKMIIFIKHNYGINLTKKKNLVKGRMNNYLIQHGFTNFNKYVRHIIKNKNVNLINDLVNKLTTNHTYFMREVEHFDYFNENILPYLYKTTKGKDLRIWSAGCSTGEEPYTLAMIIEDYFRGEKEHWDKKILATDISARVLDIAQKGIYSKEKTLVLPDKWKNQYFREINNQEVAIEDTLKKQVIFRRLNLMNEVFPLKRKFQVIFCRNVMIYFDIETRKNLAKKFYEYTEKGGYLFIGQSESLNFKDIPYKYIMPAVYRKE